jgi:hypothetical protein|tara:strand:+ start:327 stop:959 length:633 start_codon:yes stop_codon:yes gene_type:complete
MLLREITEQRQQVNEALPLIPIIWAVRAGFAAYGLYSAKKAYDTFRSWQNDELTDSEFAAQIGEDAFNTLAGLSGGLAAVKATQMTFLTFKGAWQAMKSGSGAASFASARTAGGSAVNYTLGSMAATDIANQADFAHEVYKKYVGGHYDMPRVRRELGREAAIIFRNVLIFWGLTKVAAMTYRVFVAAWRRIALAAATGAGASASATPNN